MMWWSGLLATQPLKDLALTGGAAGIGASSVMLAQVIDSGGVLSSAQELVGGSILMLVSVVSIRMVLSASRFQSEAHHTTVAQQRQRIEDLEGDVLELREMLRSERTDHKETRDRLLATATALATERQLRIALEGGSDG